MIPIIMLWNVHVMDTTRVVHPGRTPGDLTAEPATTFPMYNATRWFSRRACLDALVPALPWLILFLSKKGSRENLAQRGPRRLKEKWSGVDSLLLRLRSIQLLALTIAARDLVALMDNFSQCMQRDGVTSVEVANEVTELVGTLRECVVGGKPMPQAAAGPKVGQKRHLAGTAEQCDPVDSLQADSTCSTSQPCKCSAAMKRFHDFLDSVSLVEEGKSVGDHCWDARNGTMGRKVLLCSDEGNVFNDQECMASVQTLAHAMANDLAARFPSSDDVKMFSLLEPSTWSESSKVCDHHEVLLQKLTTMFRECVGDDQSPIFSLPPMTCVNARLAALYGIKEELRSWAHYMHNLPAGTSLLAALGKIRANPQLARVCSRFVRLSYFYLAIPCQSASVEREFSHHRALKTTCRNRLVDATMDSLMRVKLAVSKDEITTFDLTSAGEVYESGTNVSVGRSSCLINRIMQEVHGHAPIIV
jgi:hypothetical protein